MFDLTKRMADDIFVFFTRSKQYKPKHSFLLMMYYIHKYDFGKIYLIRISDNDILHGHGPIIHLIYNNTDVFIYCNRDVTIIESKYASIPNFDVKNIADVLNAFNKVVNKEIYR